MSKHKAREDRAAYAGSGNVYADLGYENADEMLVKAQLVSKTAEIIQRKGFTQVEAATLIWAAKAIICGVSATCWRSERGTPLQ